MQHHSVDLGVVGERLVEIRRLERRVPDPARLDHRGPPACACRAGRLPGAPALATIVARGRSRSTTGKVMSKLTPKIVLSRLDGAEWTRKGLRPFLEYRDLGLAEATEGRVGGTIGRAIKKFEPGGGARRHFHNTSFHLIFVMRGWFRTEFEGLGEVT